jgi:hypothetical protein
MDRDLRGDRQDRFLVIPVVITTVAAIVLIAQLT